MCFKFTSTKHSHNLGTLSTNSNTKKNVSDHQQANGDLPSPCLERCSTIVVCTFQMLIHPSEVQIASLEPSGENEHERTSVENTAVSVMFLRKLDFRYLRKSKDHF